MKLNKLMAVLAAGVSMMTANSALAAAQQYFIPYGITNLPLSFSGTLYSFQTNYNYDPTITDVYTTNVVKRGGNLQNRGGSTTLNFSEVENDSYANANYTYATFNTYNYVRALNNDPLFANVYPAAPTNSQLTFNLYTREFWLIGSIGTNPYTFNLSSNWWVYTWTNVIQTSYMYDTNVYTVSNTFASRYSANDRLQGWYSDSCGSSYTYTNVFSANNDFSFVRGGGKFADTRVAGYTGSLGNKVSQSYSGAEGVTNIQVGEIYLSTGTNLQFALTGYTVIMENRTMATNTLASIGYANFPAVSTATLNATLNGVASFISQPSSYTTNNSYHFYGGLGWDITTPFAGFIGSATGSQTANVNFVGIGG